MACLLSNFSWNLDQKEPESGSKDTFRMMMMRLTSPVASHTLTLGRKEQATFGSAVKISFAFIFL